MGAGAGAARQPLHALLLPTPPAVPKFKSWEHVRHNVHAPREVGAGVGNWVVALCARACGGGSMRMGGHTSLHLCCPLVRPQVGRRMFYSDEQGETVPASDDEDSDEPERVRGGGPAENTLKL